MSAYVRCSWTFPATTWLQNKSFDFIFSCLSDVDRNIAHGLQETREALTSESGKSHSRGTRGGHVEGPGSKNIHLEDVTMSIVGDQGSIDLLKSSDLHLSAGHIYGLVGRNGSGKTTLLRKLGARAIPGIQSPPAF